MGGLFVQQIGDLDGLPMELVLLVANVADAVAGDGVYAAHVVVQLVLVRQPHLTANDDAVGGGEGLRGDAGFRLLGEEGVENRVGDAVAHLIRVPLGDGFRGEEVVVACHEKSAPVYMPCHVRKPLWQLRFTVP